MNEAQPRDEAFRNLCAVHVAAMAQIMALTELVEELACRVGVTSIHGLSVQDGLKQRTEELSERILSDLEHPHLSLANLLQVKPAR